MIIAKTIIQSAKQLAKEYKTIVNIQTSMKPKNISPFGVKITTIDAVFGSPDGLKGKYVAGLEFDIKNGKVIKIAFVAQNADALNTLTVKTKTEAKQAANNIEAATDLFRDFAPEK